MREGSTRRTFLTAAVACAAAPPIVRLSSGAANAAEAQPTEGNGLPASWPTQAPEQVREMVGVSHGNIIRVRELLAERPSLARAAWDWGFGDWETALGAASHVGNREIAGLLLENGANPTIFSAAMLGQLATVRAFVEASPGIQKTKGPHGLTLLHHARAGGEAAQAVVEYLEKAGDADGSLPLASVSEADQAALLGTYRFGAGENEKIVVATNRFGLTFERSGTAARNLFHLGDLSFHPAGVEGVRIRFERDGARIVALSVHDPGPIVRATRSAP